VLFFHVLGLKGAGISIGVRLGVVGVIVATILFVAFVVPMIMSGVEQVEEAVLDSQLDESVQDRSLNLKRELAYSGEITYHVDTIPQNIPDKEIVRSSILLAFNEWEKLNSDLVFVESESEYSDIRIIWDEKITGSHSGLGLKDCIGIGAECWIEVGLGSENCHGEYIQYGEGLVTNTIMHEVGHTLGLGHTSNENHLMYSTDIDYNYDDLGFNIPTTFDGAFAGYLELEKKYDDLFLEVSYREEKLNQLGDKTDRLKVRYSKQPQIVEDAIEYNRVMAIYDEYVNAIDNFNAYNDDTNEIIDKVNVLVEELNCYYPEPTSMMWLNVKTGEVTEVKIVKLLEQNP